MKLKASSSERIKKRYILIEGKKEDVEKAILDYIGILGWARAGVVWVDVRGLKKGEVLSVDRREIMNVRAAFEAAGAKIKVIRVSGTLKGLGIKD